MASSSLPLTLLFCLFFAISCGGGGNGGNSSSLPPVDLGNSSLLGNWVQPCDSSNGSTSQTTSIQFLANGTFIRTGNASSEPGCSVVDFNVSTSGRVIEGNPLDTSDGRGAIELDMITDTYLLTPRSDSAVEIFNFGSICGISNWQANVEVDISDCPNRPGEVNGRPVPFVDFLIYSVERGQLFFGTELSFTASNRPTELARFPTFIRDTGAEGDEFPPELLGFWADADVPELLLELSEQGSIRFYSTTEEGCYTFNPLSLFSLGGVQYRDAFNLFILSLSVVDGNLLLSFADDPQVFEYLPAAITQSDLLLCP